MKGAWTLVLAAVAAMAAAASVEPVSIEKYGAIPDNSSTAAAAVNSRAISAALMAQSNGGAVLVPAGKSYTVLGGSALNSGKDVTFILDGTLVNSEDINAWNTDSHNNTLPSLSFNNIQGLNFTGTGLMNGKGYWWWWCNILGGCHTRPLLVAMQNVTDLSLGSTDPDNYLRFEDAPYYHFYLKEILRAEVFYSSIKVNVTAQASLHRSAANGELDLPFTGAALAEERERHASTATMMEAALMAHPKYSKYGDEMVGGVRKGSVAARAMLEERFGAAWSSGLFDDNFEDASEEVGDFPIPTFPLNTDGFDILGRDIHVHDVYVENFDDSVCVKPLGSKSAFGCAENYLSERVDVHLGVGMTIGSVPSSVDNNCVRNVTFRDIVATAPIKGIYVKSNPPDDSSQPTTGTITDVLYENYTSKYSIWYPLYFGPQQQKQPGGAGPGWDPPSNPDVTMNNMTFRSINNSEIIWFDAGVFHRNATNPSKNIVLDHVYAHSPFNSSINYVCIDIYGEVIESDPVPACFKPGP